MVTLINRFRKIQKKGGGNKEKIKSDTDDTLSHLNTLWEDTKNALTRFNEIYSMFKHNYQCLRFWLKLFSASVGFFFIYSIFCFMFCVYFPNIKATEFYSVEWQVFAKALKGLPLFKAFDERKMMKLLQVNSKSLSVRLFLGYIQRCQSFEGFLQSLVGHS